MNHKTIKTVVLAGLLCAIGIIIPMFSPVKVVIEPASFTLASHVAIMIAIFISPTVAVAVSLGTTLGFLLGGFHILIVLRALTHVIFAFIGAKYVQKRPNTLDSPWKSTGLFSVLSIIHAACEVLVISPFFFGSSGHLSASYYDNGYMYSVFLLIGVGGFIHSMVDFAISYIIWRPLRKSLGDTPAPAKPIPGKTV